MSYLHQIFVHATCGLGFVLLLCTLRYAMYTHTRLTALCLGLPGWAGTRKVKPIWILLQQETMSGSGISWPIDISAPRSRQRTMPAPHHSVFYRPDALPAAQPTVSAVKALKAKNQWRQYMRYAMYFQFLLMNLCFHRMAKIGDVQKRCILRFSRWQASWIWHCSIYSNWPTTVLHLHQPGLKSSSMIACVMLCTFCSD